MGKSKEQLSLKNIGSELLGPNRKSYWRSLDQLAQTDEFNQWVEDEFPNRGSLLNIDRRDFVKLMGASMLMASLAGCRSLPQEKIIPYVKMPEGLVTGQVQYYSTAFTMGGFALGVMAESRSGRPGKLDGHPGQSSTLGSSDTLLQGSLYDMYDPDRSQSVMTMGRVSTWEEFGKAFRGVLSDTPGERIVVLSQTVTSPSLTAQIKALGAKKPGSNWLAWEPVNFDQTFGGTNAAFGQALMPLYDLTKADIVVSLDDDFFSQGPARIRNSRDFASRRGLASEEMNRLYAVHSAATVVSAMADHRLPVKPSEVEGIARSIAQALQGGEPSGAHAGWVKALASDVRGAQGKVAFLVGAHQPSVVHSIAHALNAQVGGECVRYIQSPITSANNQAQGMKSLVESMNAGAVDVLLILGGNPVYEAPGDIHFAEALGKVKHVVHMGTHVNETALAAEWHLPESHYLESWGDGKAHDGTLLLQQPLIAPLYDSKSVSEAIEFILGGHRSGKEIVMASNGGVSDKAWEQAFHDGNLGGAASFVPVAANPNVFSQVNTGRAADLELVVLPDPTVYDGRFANNAWLQELPKPMSSVTWDNGVCLSPGTAKELGVEQEDIVELSAGNVAVVGPVLIVPGQADHTVVVHMGYGKTAGGTICTATSTTMPETSKMYGAKGVGFNAYPLTGAASFAASASIKKLGGKWAIATVQVHHSMEGRDIVRSGTLAELKENPSMAPHGAHHTEGELPTLYDQTTKDGVGQYKWGMTIDLNLCIGCNACTIACQAENNIPAVGKEQVARGREMHWLRVDRYNVGDANQPDETVFQPVACMHCEKAPCEPVCPVAATTHSKEGLNQMVYNRCVGTRYCSNNCPYKVRRFNFLNFHDKVDKPSITLLNNPDVTVRGRGVMEKCTYCVQRINRARINAKKAGESIQDGAIVTACEAACPTKAITFGDLNNKEGRVAKKAADPRNYHLLEELNTTPRTSYLGRVRNPNAALAAESTMRTTEGETH